MDTGHEENADCKYLGENTFPPQRNQNTVTQEEYPLRSQRSAVGRMCQNPPWEVSKRNQTVKEFSVQDKRSTSVIPTDVLYGRIKGTALLNQTLMDHSMAPRFAPSFAHLRHRQRATIQANSGRQRVSGGHATYLVLETHLTPGERGL